MKLFRDRVLVLAYKEGWLKVNAGKDKVFRVELGCIPRCDCCGDIISGQVGMGESLCDECWFSRDEDEQALMDVGRVCERCERAIPGPLNTGEDLCLACYDEYPEYLSNDEEFDEECGLCGRKVRECDRSMNPCY